MKSLFFNRKRGVTLLSLIVLLLVVPTTVIVQPFTVSDNLENRWRWMPASGAADQYIIEKYVVNQWSTYRQVPATAEPDGFVYATIVSPDVEIYKIRVIAVDAAGNQGMPSPESDYLLVFPQAGRPEIVK